MRKRRCFYFNKIKKDVEMDYEHLIPTEIVPGYTLDLPDMHWTVVSDNKIVIAMFTIFAVMQEKGKKIQFISITTDNQYDCKIELKANEKDYIDFCQALLSLLKDDIEEVHINVG